MKCNFYVGQPVVCIYGPWDWHKLPCDPGIPLPYKGVKYILSDIRINDAIHQDVGVTLEGFDPNWLYAAYAFEPLTKKLVEELLTTRVPFNSKYEERRDEIERVHRELIEGTQ